ncbi:hypothetical protein JCM16358_08600 [Halanaerocella petrolearia]
MKLRSVLIVTIIVILFVVGISIIKDDIFFEDRVSSRAKKVDAPRLNLRGDIYDY